MKLAGMTPHVACHRAITDLETAQRRRHCVGLRLARDNPAAAESTRLGTESPHMRAIAKMGLDSDGNSDQPAGVLGLMSVVSG